MIFLLGQLALQACQTCQMEPLRACCVAESAQQLALPSLLLFAVLLLAVLLLAVLLLWLMLLLLAALMLLLLILLKYGL